MELVKDVDTEYKDYLRIRNVLKKGFRTKDIFSNDNILVGCEEMGNKIIEELEHV